MIVDCYIFGSEKSEVGSWILRMDVRNISFHTSRSSLTHPTSHFDISSFEFWVLNLKLIGN